jgi:hypothetical protein
MSSPASIIQAILSRPELARCGGVPEDSDPAAAAALLARAAPNDQGLRALAAQLGPPKGRAPVGLERALGHRPLRPLGRLRDTAWAVAQDLGQEARQHWKAVVPMAALSGLLTWQIFSDPDCATGTSYVDVQTHTRLAQLDMPNLEFEDIMAKGFSPKFDTEKEVDTSTTCHSHLRCAFGPQVADAVAWSGFDLPHCITVAGWGGGFVAGARGFFDAYNTRWEAATYGPVADLAHTLGQGTQFAQSVERGARAATNFWIRANTFENITFHLIIPFAGMWAGWRAGNMRAGEASDALRQAWDGVQGFSRARPLTVTFGAAAACGAVLSHGVWDPSAIWLGVLGLLAGRSTEDILRRRQAPARVVRLTATVRDELDALARTPEGAPTPRSKRPRRRALATLGLGGAAMADLAITGGHTTGYLAGAFAVSAGFIFGQFPEDLALHGGLGAMGVASGVLAALATRSARHALHVSQ